MYCKACHRACPAVHASTPCMYREHPLCFRTPLARACCPRQEKMWSRCESVRPFPSTPNATTMYARTSPLRTWPDAIASCPFAPSPLPIAQAVEALRREKIIAIPTVQNNFLFVVLRCTVSRHSTNSRNPHPYNLQDTLYGLAASACSSSSIQVGFLLLSVCGARLSWGLWGNIQMIYPCFLHLRAEIIRRKATRVGSAAGYLCQRG